jgi:serine/threonine protein kinase
MSSSAWYQDADAIIAQVRRTGAARGAAPVIAGYDDLVEIRRGGQGVVYAATQRSTRRRVAIKLLLDGAFASDVSRRRFEREIELVGALRNPHIVRIYDSGVANDGHPYFVMEFVDGAPLDRYVIDSGLTNSGQPSSAADARSRIDRLLRLFLPICEAVQYAHQRGVIHRDLKPANIRVDSDGAPRVLDFGLARAGGGSSVAGADATELTSSGQFMGSLPWASPEHAGGNPDAIDTRSDIYSLGVVLHYLLTGQFPYTVQGALRDVLENIMRAEPHRPSESAVGISSDLDTIVLKCLAKEPDRRYQSAADLADDIRHYLADEPIQARRDSMWYVLKKKARRYQVLAAAAAAVIVIAIVGLSVSLSLWRNADQQRLRADKERQVAQDQRHVAQQKTNQAQAVNDFLFNMLSAADPTTRGKDVRVVDLLSQSSADADRIPKDQPETEISVRTAIGRSYLMLGLFPEADAQFAAALKRAEALPMDATEMADETRRLLGELRLRQGRLEEAESTLRDALDRRRGHSGVDDERTLAVEHSLATVLLDRGKTEEAELMARLTLENQRRVLGPEHGDTLQSIHFLATCLTKKGKLDEARELFELSLETRRRTMGDEHSDTITSMIDLAVVLTDLGEDDRAEPLRMKAYELAKRVYGEEHPRTLTLMNNIGSSWAQHGRAGEAVDLLLKTLAIERRVLGPENPSVLVTMSNLGSAYKQNGRHAEAEPLLRELVETATRVLGPDHPNTLTLENNYAATLLTLKRPSEAEPVLRKAYHSAARTMGEAHWLTAFFRGNLGRSIMFQNRFEHAEPHLLAAHDTLLKSLGPNHQRTKDAAADLVTLYEGWQKPDRAALYRAKGEEMQAVP